MNYDANDRITSDVYDNNGNTINTGGIGNVYDFENHLVQRGNVFIVYDGDGSLETYLRFEARSLHVLHGAVQLGATLKC